MSKVVGIFVKFWHFFTMLAHQIWSHHVTQTKNFYFFLILHLILGKVTKFLVEKLSTSEVISQKPHGGGGMENTPFRVKNREVYRRINSEHNVVRL